MRPNGQRQYDCALMVVAERRDQIQGLAIVSLIALCRKLGILVQQRLKCQQKRVSVSLEELVIEGGSIAAADFQEDPIQLVFGIGTLPCALTWATCRFANRPVPRCCTAGAPPAVDDSVATCKP